MMGTFWGCGSKCHNNESIKTRIETSPSMPHDYHALCHNNESIKTRIETYGSVAHIIAVA